MGNESSERVRASNIIWNASGDYSVDSDISAYDENGKANLYMNYIIGAVHRYYDYPLLQDYFNKLDGTIDHELFIDLIWTGLENCAFLRGRIERPVLESLRRSYAGDFLSRYGAISIDAGVADSVYYDYILDEVKLAHFRRALGEQPVVSGMAENVLNDLEFDLTMDTPQIIARMDKIIQDYFRPGLIPMSRRGRRSRRGRVFFLNFSRSNASEYSNGPDVWGTVRGRGNAFSLFFRLFDRSSSSNNKFIQSRYGVSSLPEDEMDSLEKTLCVGAHSTCRLHFTKGESPSRRNRDAMQEQRSKNESSFKSDYTRNRTGIIRLTNIIKNAMLINLEPSAVNAESGILEAGKAWRSVRLNDDKVFTKKIRNNTGDLAVDIMLDASASQVDRQETIAAEAYIIAESLTRCGIPVRVFSYCSEKDYTVINFFRGYAETGENSRIFNYFASGCNRDGLAIRTAVNLIKDEPFDHKLLIVLTDGVPNDYQGVPVGRFVNNDYLGGAGINDAALEVRKGWQHGISILCVFTGRDANIPDAKKIYGHNLAYIKSQNRFADIVGVMIQNELRNF